MTWTKNKSKRFEELQEEEWNSEDNIITILNEQTIHRNKILQLGHKRTQEERQLELIRSQKRELLGRKIIKLEEVEKNGKSKG